MLTDQLITELAEKTDPLIPAPVPARLFLRWSLLSVVYIALCLCFMGIRPDFTDKLHSFLFIAELAAIAGIIASSLFSAALLAFPDMYQKKALTWLPALAFLLFAAVLYLEFRADNPPAPLPNHSHQCLLCITALALIPGAFVLYSIRRFASTHYYMAGKVAVLAAFSTGAMILRFSEATDSMHHLLEWHYLPMIGAGIVGLIAGRLCLKW